jgi:hypothetical protein
VRNLNTFNEGGTSGPGRVGESPYPPDMDYTVEALSGDLWVPFKFRIEDLGTARETRDSFRAQAPDVKFRIVEWYETSKVIETDEVTET